MTTNVPLVDRSSLMSGLYNELVLKPRETAVVTIDMHRGHLDMDVATMPAKPEDAKRVIARAREVLDFCRRIQIPVVHVVLVYRKLKNIGSEGMTRNTRSRSASSPRVSGKNIRR